MTTAVPPAVPLPPELANHPVLAEHPHIASLVEEHGGVPHDQLHDEDTVESALAFANAVATHAVEPGTKTGRTDPSPRRAARVWRSEILGHRDPSVSPERRASTGSLGGNSGSYGGNLQPSPPVRYRSRSRPPTTGTVKEEPEERKEDDSDDFVPRIPGRPGKRDMPPEPTGGMSGVTALEHRVSAMVQQQHEFHDGLLRRLGALERRLDVADARNTNKINAYLGLPLTPVPNGRGPIPADLTPLTSLDVIRSLSASEVERWIEYYTGTRPEADGDDRAARQALRACTGVDVQVL